MPRSPNRRTIEVPAQLYEELKARAAQEGTTIPAILQALITDGKSVEEWYGEMLGLLRAVHRDVSALRDQQEQWQAVDRAAPTRSRIKPHAPQTS